MAYNGAMQRHVFFRGAVAVAMIALALPAIATISAGTHTRATTTLSGSVAAVAAKSPGVGAVSGAKRETIELWMAGRQRAAQRFAGAVSTPGSSSYRRFLSPSAYTQRFGPTTAQVNAVHAYLTGAGFSGVHASVNDDYISATAPVSTINRAFSVQMRRYQVAGAGGKKATIESNDRGLTLPASISADILAVTGLNTAAPKGSPAATVSSRRASTKGPACSQYWAQKTHTITPAFQGLTEAAVPPCGYSAKQLRAAYGLTAANTGKGETIALIQIGGPDAMFQTLTDYARVNGLPVPRRSRYHEQEIGQGDRNPKCLNLGSLEAPLDSESAYAMAPDANQLMVDGDDCHPGTGNYAQSLFDAELAPLTGTGSKPSAQIESVSYLFDRSEKTTVASQLKVVHAIALRAAAEGVSLLTSSGDQAGVSSASDPDITVVGGTTLGIGAHNQRVFETGWSTAVAERANHASAWKDRGVNVASGGGVSNVAGEPGYQKCVVPSSMARNQSGKPGRTVPDLSADGDPATGGRFGFIVTHPNGKTGPYTPFTDAGTSMATPLVAGIVADAEQGRPSSFGFLNPLLYSLAGTRAFHDALPLTQKDPQVDRGFYQPGLVERNHKLVQGVTVNINDAQGRPGTRQVTARGYDTMTGLGTPNGRAFIDALRSGK
jgi:subtilase family serine protease